MRARYPSSSGDGGNEAQRRVCGVLAGLEDQIKFVSWTLEFGWILQYYADPEELVRLWRLGADDFATHCYENGVNPATPRRGRAHQKAWRAQINTALAEGNVESARKIVGIMAKRVVGEKEATDMRKILESPAGAKVCGKSRMHRFNKVAANGRGDFEGAKNYAEAFSACGLVSWTDEELRDHKEGTGAKDMAEKTGVGRCELVTECNRLLDRFEEAVLAGRSVAGKWETRARITKESLGFGCFDEVVAQYWQCQYGRILRQVAEIWKSPAAAQVAYRGHAPSWIHVAQKRNRDLMAAVPKPEKNIRWGKKRKARPSLQQKAKIPPRRAAAGGAPRRWSFCVFSLRCAQTRAASAKRSERAGLFDLRERDVSVFFA